MDIYPPMFSELYKLPVFVFLCFWIQIVDTNAIILAPVLFHKLCA